MLEKEVLKTTLKASFVNEDGSVEEWAEGMTEEELVEKIDKDFDPPLVHTIRGAGYSLRVPD